MGQNDDEQRNQRTGPDQSSGDNSSRVGVRIAGPGQNIKAILYDARLPLGDVVAALYKKDEPAGRDALERLEQLIPDPQLALGAEEIEVLELYARWLDWQLTIVFHEEQRDTKRDWLLEQLASAQATRLGQIMRAKLELQLHCNSEGPGHLDFTPERFHALYAQIPADERHSELMYYAASWAFRHRELPVLEDCFEHFTFHSDGHNADYVWQYVNIMYQLLRGAATARDVEEHLKRVNFLHELKQFELFILPEIERQGLLTGEVRQAIEDRRTEIASRAPQPPAPELPTKRIRS